MVESRRTLPPVYFLAAVGTMVLAHFYFPIVHLTSSPWRFLGILLIVSAALFIFWIAYLFNRAGTTIKPYEESSALVTYGPYRFSRNPIYLGMVVVLLGFASLFGSLSPFLVIPTFALMIQEKFIKMEEQMLEERFGEEYREFCKRVRRWV